MVIFKSKVAGNELAKDGPVAIVGEPTPAIPVQKITIDISEEEEFYYRPRPTTG